MMMEKAAWDVPVGDIFVDKDWLREDYAFLIAFDNEQYQDDGRSRYLVCPEPVKIMAAYDDRLVVECGCGCSAAFGRLYARRIDLFHTKDEALEETAKRNRKAEEEEHG